MAVGFGEAIIQTEVRVRAGIQAIRQTGGPKGLGQALRRPKTAQAPVLRVANKAAKPNGIGLAMWFIKTGGFAAQASAGRGERPAVLASRRLSIELVRGQGDVKVD